MIKLIFVPFVVLVLLLLTSCRKKDTDNFRGYTFRFEKDPEGWQPFFSDYPVGKEAQYELLFRHSRLPLPLNTTTPALELHGNNNSDDLLSMIYRKFEGLKANTTYQVSFRVELASNIATSSIGIGGSPDLSLGGGGLSYEPDNMLDDTDIEYFNRPNFESRLQSHEPNENFALLGTIGVSESTSQYTLISRDNIQSPISLQTNGNGELWLMIGTDSGFEGPLTLYFKEIEVRIK